MMNILTPTDKAQKNVAGAIVVICAILSLAAPFSRPAAPMVAQSEARAQPTAAPQSFIVITATPSLPTARPTIAPTDAPAPVVQAPVVQTDPPTPVVVYVEVPVEVPVEAPPAPEQIIAAPIMPPDTPRAAEAHEVAPGIEHGSRPVTSNKPGMPDAKPQP